ncbi:hypothetical protein M1555_04030 [Patescibacteria group bacterium]|nr:hypothetical protein [Patescibacteria group bacterium]
MRRYIPERTKQRARTLRRQGRSIGQIANDVLVAKSTVYEWVRSMSNERKYALMGRQKWIREIQPLGALAQKRKREEKIQKIVTETKQEINSLDIGSTTKKAMLAMLYWSEGCKGRGPLVFVNTDPRRMKLFITLLRHCYHIDECRLRVRLHLHWYHNEAKVKKFWSALLSIPETQFMKTYRKDRSKEKTFRRNFGGICFLRYNNDYLREQIVHFSLALGEHLTGSIHVPVA